jgi:membrane protein
LVPGTSIDPPDVDTPVVRHVVDDSDTAAFCWRWWERFRDGHGTLAAKGIAFYGFFSLLAAVVLGYGVVFARFPAGQLVLSTFLESAFPGLIGPEAIDPELLADTAATIGVVGAVVLLYSAIAVIRAMDQGVRLVFGVQFDPRGLLVKSLRHVWLMLVLVPIFVASYLSTTITSGLFAEIGRLAGFTPNDVVGLARGAGFLGGVALNAVGLWLVMTWLTGQRPPQRARRIGAAVGAVAFEAVKLGSAFAISLILANPRYAAFGIPIAFLLLFFAMASVLLAAAALTATIAEPDPVMAARRRQALPPSRPLPWPAGRAPRAPAPDPAAEPPAPG